MSTNKHIRKGADQYSFADLVKLFGVGPSTLKKWIEPFAEELGEKKDGYYSQKQLEIMIEYLGLPDINE